MDGPVTEELLANLASAHRNLGETDTVDPVEQLAEIVAFVDSVVKDCRELERTLGQAAAKSAELNGLLEARTGAAT